MNDDDIMSILQCCNSEESNQIICGIISKEIEIDSFDRCDRNSIKQETIDIYKRRVVHLESIGGYHAAVLAKQVHGLIDVLSLESSIVEYTGILSKHKGILYYCWVISNPRKMVIIQSYDKRQFSKTEWDALWQ
jgi:hypothetical protein